MIKNMGKTDRILRVIVGLVLLGLALLTEVLAGSVLNVLAVVVGLVMVLTALVGVCPAYLPFGIKTCRKG